MEYFKFNLKNNDPQALNKLLARMKNTFVSVLVSRANYKGRGGEVLKFNASALCMISCRVAEIYF